jgi:hypothetical protein
MSFMYVLVFFNIVSNAFNSQCLGAPYCLKRKKYHVQLKTLNVSSIPFCIPCYCLLSFCRSLLAFLFVVICYLLSSLVFSMYVFFVDYQTKTTTNLNFNQGCLNLKMFVRTTSHLWMFFQDLGLATIIVD